MASVKLRFRASSSPDKEGTVFIQVIHRRVVRQASTGYRLYPSEWDVRKQAVTVPADTSPSRARYLRTVRKHLEEDATRLRDILQELAHARKDYPADEVIRRFLRKERSDEFLTFGENLVRQRQASGRISLAEKYRTSLSSLKRFLGDRVLTFEEMDSSLLLDYESYLRGSGCCPNTSSFYLRNLRAIYNQAVEQGLTEQRHPFSRVYTGIAKTLKRAISAEDIKRLKALDLEEGSVEEQSRDFFLFSFYACGMSMVDMAHLKESDLSGDYLTYCRQKTGQRIHIGYAAGLRRLVEKYATGDSPYLLPILHGTDEEARRHYRSTIHRVNKHLKRLGERLGLSVKLTTYVARHFWASIAKSCQVPISAISEALGHTSEATTRIYLKELECMVVEMANRKVPEAIV